MSNNIILKNEQIDEFPIFMYIRTFCLTPTESNMHVIRIPELQGYKKTSLRYKGNFWVNPRGWLNEPGDGGGERDRVRNKGPSSLLSRTEGTGKASAAAEAAALLFDLRTEWK